MIENNNIVINSVNEIIVVLNMIDNEGIVVTNSWIIIPKNKEMISNELLSVDLENIDLFWFFIPKLWNNWDNANVENA